MKPNTVDLRGLEQVGTYREAEQLAALQGYEMFYYGSAEPHDVDLEEAAKWTENRLLVVDSKEDLLQLMDGAPSYNLGVVAGKLGAGVMKYIEQCNLDETPELNKRWELLRELENWDTEDEDVSSNYRLMHHTVLTQL